jgi:hypothetical protein
VADSLDRAGLSTLLARLFGEPNLVADRQSVEGVTKDVGTMKVHFAPVVGLQKAKALLGM